MIKILIPISLAGLVACLASLYCVGEPTTPERAIPYRIVVKTRQFEQDHEREYKKRVPSMTAEAEATAQAIVRLSATPSYATVTVLTAAPIATSTWTAKVKIATVVSDLNLETQTPTAGERRIAREVHNANADEQLSTREAYRPEPKPWTKVELADSWDDVIRLEPSPKGSIGGPFAGRMFEVGKYTDHFAKWVQVRFGRCGYRQSGEVCPSQADWGVKQSYCWTEEGNPIVTGGYWTNPKDSRSSVRSPCPRSHVTYWNPYDGYRK